jgi:uncharacterized protein YgiM (DUF1202 family)
MKKTLALCWLLLMIVPAFALATTLTVQVTDADLRSEPALFGKIIGRVKYHSAVNVIEERGAWRLVTVNGKQGWMHISKLVAGNLNLSAGKNISSSVSSRDVSLAGKGFNPETEQAFKQQHRSLSFSGVDKMEQVKISPMELENFALQSDFPRVSR